MAPVIYGKPRECVMIVDPIKKVGGIVFVRLIFEASRLGSVYSSPDIPQPLA